MTTEDDRNRIQRLLNAITLLERDVERQQAVQDQALERLKGKEEKRERGR